MFSNLPAHSNEKLWFHFIPCYCADRPRVDPDSSLWECLRRGRGGCSRGSERVDLVERRAMENRVVIERAVAEIYRIESSSVQVTGKFREEKGKREKERDGKSEPLFSNRVRGDSDPLFLTTMQV